MANYISKILINGVEYEIKDTVARQGGIRFILSTNAATTPAGVTWKDGSTTITGTLAAADADPHAIYLVPGDKTTTKNIYREFVVVGEAPNQVWEQMGDTEVDLKDVVTGVTLNKGTGDIVLGESTTFTAASSAVSFTGQTSGAVIKTVTPGTKNLDVTTITGINGSQSITPVTSSTNVNIPNVSLGADKTASHIVTESKTATNTVFGTSETVNKVSAGTAKDVAKAGTAVTQVLSGDVGQVFTAASVTNEVLSFTTVTVTKNSITPAVSNGTITPVTIGTAVTVPQVTSNSGVTIASVKTNDDVAVPTVSLGDDIVASKVTLGTAVSLAKPAGASTTVATGSISDTGTGDAVVSEVNTTNQTVVTAVGTGTAAGQTITVGANDKVTVAKHGDLSLTVTKGNQ